EPMRFASRETRSVMMTTDALRHSSGRRGPLSVAPLMALALLLVLVAPATTSGAPNDLDAHLETPFHSLSLSLATLAGAQVDDFGPGTQSSSIIADRTPVRLDVLFGAFIPFENDNLGFGAAASDESFDVGGMFGFRLDFWLTENVRLGGEIDFASHDVDGGPIFFPGRLDRVFFLVPLTIEQSFGDPNMPWTIGVSIAPGFQVAIPDVDHFIEDIEAFSGRFIDQDTFVALNVRASVAIRVPITPTVRFFTQGAFDFAWGTADVFVRNAIG